MKKYKHFVIGFLVGAMLFSIIPASAAIEEFLCYKADYKVMVNGSEYISEELPILNYKGNTYAPFRGILEKAGLNVNWNAELGQAEVTSNLASVQMSTTAAIEYDLDTGLPVSAEVIDYKGCNGAVKYNGNTYLSLSDLFAHFGIKSKFIDVKTNVTTFAKDNNIVLADLKISGNHFLDSVGKPYYNVKLFNEILGE
ncbi:MAG: hypothetical protein K0R80_165 [Clostridia bacterium]|jgi:hypothetical protein|nr:hypothetical protein [Clostridia bacterium]